MAEKLTINQPRPKKTAQKAPAKPSRMPQAVAMVVGAGALLAFSLTQVGRVSPKRGDVEGIVRDIRKESAKTSAPLPSGVNPTRGTKLWKKGSNPG